MATKGKKSLTDEEISVIKKLHADGKNNQVILGILLFISIQGELVKY